MGKVTGFMEANRQAAEYREKKDRTQDWREFVVDRPEETARTQGGRCMDCGVPFCQQGCPLGNPIPEFNDLVYRGRWKQAFEVLRATNNFPEFTGRLCPAPCESACVLSINNTAVTIEQTEKEIIERAFAEGWVEPQRVVRRTGRSVAVVGSGPAGLAAADQLNRAGHTVTVYEKSDRIGGLLRYGIPDFKLEKWVIERRISLLRTEGITFSTGVEIGKDIRWTDLLEDHDAVVVCIGAGKPRDLDVPGRDLQGVHMAMNFLPHQNHRVAGDFDTTTGVVATGKHVVILGGGDTGSDCLGTSIRHGAASVTQIELMPAPPSLRAHSNPWPHWPMVFRTSSSQAEGGAREFAQMTTRLIGENGVLKEIEMITIEMVTEDGRSVVRPVPGSEKRLPCDLLILAMGFAGPVLDSLQSQLTIDVTPRGVPAGTSKFRTSVPRLYVAGDAFRGASLIVWAISDGREAARIIDADLIEAAPRLPTRGQDMAFA